jgi:5-histidylcysteine sulfoxide synthase
MIQIPTLLGNDSEVKRQEIKTYFQKTYKLYESLFSIVSDEEAYFQKADPLRHPIIFYYGHTSTFFINKLKLAKIIDERIDPKLESIFAVGVDEMSWDDLKEKHYDWPTLEETQNYRDKVYALVNELIDTLPLELPLTWKSPWWVILMGIEHENIHIETSSVLIRQLPFASVRENSDWKECDLHGNAPENELIDVSAGTVILGKNQDAQLFGWDNEYGTHQAKIPAFKASKYVVSNGEYLEFMQDDGYLNNAYWCREGEEWKEFTKAVHPLFWHKKESNYILRTLSREIPLP